ncbi:hypothetical protein [Curtobacterium sp. NPDC089991]|uniref:TY-Chap2 family putative peptide chaperone n=1 Tax=Curtobacterium sp. NPDC089991 TaxID=3363969 RepID=UPI00380F9EFB
MGAFSIGDSGFTVIRMNGGPLDGKVYDDMPILESGFPAESISIPQAGPTESGLYARYIRRPNAEPDGRWTYNFKDEVADPHEVTPSPLPAGTTVGGSLSGEAGAEEPEPLLDSAPTDATGPFQPASRFTQAQIWWIASELCRRHATFRIVEVWPHDGFHHGLEIQEARTGKFIFMNFETSIIYLHAGGDPDYAPQMGWKDTLSADDPHDVLKSVENRMAWSTTSADVTTERSLTYRLVSTLVTSAINDRQRLNVRSHWYGESYSGPVMSPEWLAECMGLTEAVRDWPEDREYPLIHFWTLRRDQRLVAVLADDGTIYTPHSEPLKLLPIYRRRQQLGDVVERFRQTTE